MVQPEAGGVEVDSSVLARLLEALIIQKSVDVISANIKASEHESGGDLNKAIRATLGISITDIDKYGLRGGPNSELSKLLNKLGL